jgi:3-hydroxyisobutyrate dehydrogenase-like beta-hydroxyacid dehydrogenase
VLPREARAEFAGGEGIQSAEAGGKLDLGQAALAMQPPEKICRAEIVFLAVALVAAANQVAPGIVPELRKRDDVIQAASCRANAAQAIKARVAKPRARFRMAERCNDRTAHAWG